MLNVLTISLLTIITLILTFLIGSTAIYFLWNWLVPSIFNLRIISFPEAFGLLILFRFLIGPVTYKITDIK